VDSGGCNAAHVAITAVWRERAAVLLLLPLRHVLFLLLLARVVEVQGSAPVRNGRGKTF
jgi:hypothetical protein